MQKTEQPVLAGARSAWRASTEIESQQPPTTRPVTLPAFLTASRLLVTLVVHLLLPYRTNLRKHVISKSDSNRHARSIIEHWCNRRAHNRSQPILITVRPISAVVLAILVPSTNYRTLFIIFEFFSSTIRVSFYRYGRILIFLIDYYTCKLQTIITTENHRKRKYDSSIYVDFLYITIFVTIYFND